MSYKLIGVLILISCSFLSNNIQAQSHIHQDSTSSLISANVDPQPLLAQIVRLKEALSFLGSSLSPADEKRIAELQHVPLTQEVSNKIQEIADPYCLAVIGINPEGRVKVNRGNAPTMLVQDGWTSFLVKIINDAGATAPLAVESPNAIEPQHRSNGGPNVDPKNIILKGAAQNRFIDIQMFRDRPLLPHLSGLKLEYAIVQVYSKDAGKREVEIGFNIGQGSQDIGFRNSIPVLFHIRPSVKVVLNIKDDDGMPAMASFVITDSIERVPGRLSGVYPLPSRRVAAYDEYPDFFFQRQIYRNDGEHVNLAPGKYTVTFTRGPEYIPLTKQITIPADKDSVAIAIQLKRWINLAKLGWYSADHHVHAAGCSHYDSPEEGVPPVDMWRQSLGEDLNIAAVLAWGPSWYNQKKYFTGKDHPLSTKKNLIHYDVEVSGFPSSHAGHLVLLGLKEDDYPGTTKIEEWPSWTLPVLNWAKGQGGVVGYAHSGWGLMPLTPTNALPNYIVPHMDNIGANEYIVTVTTGVVDFYSAGDTPIPWELNMWYHTLNAGFRTRLSGETDFPCITDDKVGQGRSYFNADGEKAVNYDLYLQALKKGRCYVSDGGSHIMNFAVNKLEAGTHDSQLVFKTNQTLTVTANAAAYLPELQSASFADISNRPADQHPFWHVERARIGKSRKVKVELIVNGEMVDAIEITADGKINSVKFAYPMTRSGWVALRVPGSAHSNPVFVEIDAKPILEKKSVEWCIAALDQCWKQKEPNIKPDEKLAAKGAYDQARRIYEKMLVSKN
ncbi:MAG: CehA/McbA family metallohydrolase [Sphingobacteriaceae bacterium]